MPPKTIYIKDEKQWNKAQKAAGEEGLSTVIQGLLGEWLDARERRERLDLGEFVEVKLWVGGERYRKERQAVGPVSVEFEGRLVVTSDYVSDGLSFPMPHVAVYQTRSGALVVHRDWRGAPLMEQAASFYKFKDFDALKRFPYALHTTWWIEATGEFADKNSIGGDLVEAVADKLGEIPVIRIE